MLCHASRLEICSSPSPLFLPSQSFALSPSLRSALSKCPTYSSLSSSSFCSLSLPSHLPHHSCFPSPFLPVSAVVYNTPLVPDWSPVIVVTLSSPVTQIGLLPTGQFYSLLTLSQNTLLLCSAFLLTFYFNSQIVHASSVQERVNKIHVIALSRMWVSLLARQRLHLSLHNANMTNLA